MMTRAEFRAELASHISALMMTLGDRTGENPEDDSLSEMLLTVCVDDRGWASHIDWDILEPITRVEGYVCCIRRYIYSETDADAVAESIIHSLEEDLRGDRRLSEIRFFYESPEPPKECPDEYTNDNGF